MLLCVTLAAPIFAQDAERLHQDNERLESELRALQQRLVKSAARAQAAEADLEEVADKLRILDEQLQIKNKTLAVHRKNLAALIQAALRLSRSPPEMMILRGGDADAVKIGRALKMTSEGIREDIAAIRTQTKELERLQQKTAARQQELERKQANLAREQRALAASLAERKALKEKLGDRQEEKERRAEEIAAGSGNVQTLVTGLRRRETVPDPGSRTRRRDMRAFADARGKMRLPMEGKLVKRFGTPEGRDGASKGITVTSGAPGARVVAPFDGEVVFSGPFLDYGKMVILRHSDDFHTLLAGLADIDIAVGDFLLEGEPIGAMGGSMAQNRLYMELRKDNQPVNPDPWLQGSHRKR